jgi:hypothetical protein
MPKHPGDVELRVMKEMFEASVDGQPYDTERWGQYFRPAGVQAPAGGSAPTVGSASAAVTKAAPAPVDDVPFEVDEPVAAPAAVQTKPAAKAEDILAMIRARQK